MKKALEILRTVYSEYVKLIFKSVDISTDSINESKESECISQVQCETKTFVDTKAECIDFLRLVSKRCDLKFSSAYVEDSKLCIVLVTFDKVAYTKDDIIVVYDDKVGGITRA